MPIDRTFPRTFIESLAGEEDVLVASRLDGQDLSPYQQRVDQGKDPWLYLPPKPVVAIGGTSGCGKGGFAWALQYCLKRDYRLDMPITTAGEFMREAAVTYRFPDLKSLLTYCEKEPDFAGALDREIDRKMLEATINKGGILDGRLTPFVAGNWGLRTVVKVPDIAVIGRRISADDNRPENRERKGRELPNLTSQEAEKNTIERDLRDADRYRKHYSIADFRVELGQVAHITIDNSEDVERQDGEKFRDAFLHSGIWETYYEGVIVWLNGQDLLPVKA